MTDRREEFDAQIRCCDRGDDPFDGRSRYVCRCENFKEQAAVSSDKAPGGHNLKRSRKASVDAHLNCKNWRSDALTLSAPARRSSGFELQGQPRSIIAIVLERSHGRLQWPKLLFFSHSSPSSQSVCSHPKLGQERK
jgi:hypothetical protein